MLHRVAKRLSPTSISYGLIAVGVMLRLVQYASGRSLWGDEAKLALNIVNRSYPELFQVLDYDQVAPVGFLLVEKAIAQVLGASEAALRLFPLVAGIGALTLAYQLARRTLSPLAVPIALAFVAFSSRLVYYSSEVKPYALDVALTLAILAYGAFDPRTVTRTQAIRAALIGAIAVWFSYPAVFALAGVGLVCIAPALAHQGRPHPKPIRWEPTLLTVLPWALSFLVFYAVSVHSNTGNSTLQDSWASRRAFPASLPDLDWLFYSLKRMFEKPLSFPSPVLNYLAIVAWLVGSAAFFRRGRPGAYALLMSPLVMSLLAAYLNKYPFYSRLIVFLVPLFAMVIAEGIATLLRLRWPAALAGMALAIALLYLPVVTGSSVLISPRIDEDIRPLMGYVQQHRQPGDVLYVFQKSKFQFQFYQSEYGYDADDYIVGIDPEDLGVSDSGGLRRLYGKDIKKLCGEERVWVLVADINLRSDTVILLEQLERLGQRAERIEADGLSSFVDRYDLSACGPVAIARSVSRRP